MEKTRTRLSALPSENCNSRRPREDSQNERQPTHDNRKSLPSEKVLNAVTDCARSVDDDDAISGMPDAPVRLRCYVRRLLHQRFCDAVRALQTPEGLSDHHGHSKYRQASS